MTEPLSVAFVGLGRMGARMAARLVESGFSVSVWSRSEDQTRRFAVTHGARAAQSGSDAAAGADVVVTMLTDGDALLDVLERADGILSGATAGAMLLDCSTIGASGAGLAMHACARHGVHFVACPVSGSTSLAEQGKLTLFVGGDASDVHRLEPVLRALGSRIVPMADPTAAAAMKVIVNGLLLAFNAALAESVVVGQRHGISGDSLFDALESSVLSNAFLHYKRDAYVTPGAASVAFDLANATKDLRLAAAAASEAGLPNSLAGALLAVHDEACRAGYADQDMSALATWFAASAAATERTAPMPCFEEGH